MRSLRPWKERVAAGLLIAAGLAIAGAFAWQDRHPLLTVPAAPAGTQAATSPATEQAARVDAVGSVDAPADEAIIDTNLHISGWALAPIGIERVEIRVDGRPYAARYGIARPDVAAVKPGYRDSAASGFEFSGDFANLDPVRHAVAVVAIDRSGRETVLARKSLIPPAAMSLWNGLLDQQPALANRPFRFLMMTSGVAAGGAAEADSAYRAYLSRTTGVGIAVPILYLRTTKGVSGDWEFDPDFDLRASAKTVRSPKTTCTASSGTRSKGSCQCNSSSTAASGRTRVAIRRSGTSTTTWNRTSAIANGRRTTRYSPTTI